MAALGLGSGPRCFIRGCLRSTCAPVLFVLLSLRFLPGFFDLFFKPNYQWGNGEIIKNNGCSKLNQIINGGMVKSPRIMGVQN